MSLDVGQASAHDVQQQRERLLPAIHNVAPVNTHSTSTAQPRSPPGDSDVLQRDRGRDAALPESGTNISVSGTLLSQSSGRTLDRNKGEKQTRIRFPTRKFTQLWLWEILGSLFSVSCILAIIAILSYLDGKPLDHWTLSLISPNALVSVFATMSKSAMLLTITEAISQLKWIYFQQRARRLLDFQIFDGASRGPLGAVRLLWTVKLQAILATLAALVTVFALAMGPFTQQVLSFPTRTANSGQIALISKADIWTSLLGTNVSVTYWTPEYQADLLHETNGIVSAIWAGIFAPASSPSYYCATGNCRWPSFDTIAICNSCTNVTLDTRQHCKPESPVAGEDQVCHHTLPNGFTFNVTVSDDGQTRHVGSNPLMVRLEEPDPLNYNGSIIDFTVGQFPLLDSGGVSPTFYECGLRWCVETHDESACFNGQLRDAAITRKPVNFPYCEDFAGRLQPPQSSSHGDQNARACAAVPQGTNLIYNQTTTSQLEAVNASQRYWVGIDYANELQINIDQIFGPSLQPDSSLDHDTSSFSIALNAINNANFSQTMDNMALSLTNYIRQNEHSVQVQGESQSIEVYVKVSWPWLILPATLVLLSAVLLGLSIISSMGKGVHKWKSSALAPLFYGLTDWQPSEGEANDLRQIEQNARAMRAKLDEDDRDITGFIRT